MCVVKVKHCKTRVDNYVDYVREAKVSHISLEAGQAIRQEAEVARALRIEQRQQLKANAAARKRAANVAIAKSKAAEKQAERDTALSAERRAASEASAARANRDAAFYRTFC